MLLIAIAVVVVLLVLAAGWVMMRGFRLQWKVDKTLYLTYDVPTGLFSMSKEGSRFKVDSEGHLLTADKKFMVYSGGDNGSPLVLLPLTGISGKDGKPPMPVVGPKQHELKFDEKTGLITNQESLKWTPSNLESFRRVVGQIKGDKPTAFIYNGPINDERTWTKVML